MRFRIYGFATWTASLVAVALPGCAETKRERPDWMATGAHGMVAADSAYASRVGLEILRAGGNAVDAATAVSFALGVVRPYSTGAGGGGFMILRLADGETVVLDFRETAPASAGEDMYERAASADVKRADASRYGHLAVGVPGLVAGRCHALKRYGTMPLDRVVAPAIRLARDGFEVDDHYVDTARDVLKVYQARDDLRRSCNYVYRVHLNGGRLRNAGDTLRQPALARFLERLANEGAAFFYQGAFAEALVREMTENGGLIRADDLAAYQVRERRAIVGTYRGLTIISMPPPSSGGVTLVQTLNTLEQFGLSDLFRADRGLAYHYVIEAMKHAFADRARWLADADFVPVPVDTLIAKDYAARISARIDQTATLDLDAYGSTQLADDAGTSHFCVVDRWGNVVVSTETINTSFGSLAAVDEWGVILNNQMDDFTTRPGRSNAFGLVQSDRNAVAAGKRPLSSMCPTIVLQDGQPLLMLGASGGPRIISSVLNVLLNVVELDMTLEQAIAAPRVHHQWRPNRVYFDRSPPAELATNLLSRGQSIAEDPRTGIVQAILRTPRGWVGASDPRKGGRPAGY